MTYNTTGGPPDKAFGVACRDYTLTVSYVFTAPLFSYGHVGDGNLHLNVTSPVFDPFVAGQLEPFIYEWTSGVRGSVSAEHGLGFKKRNCIHYTKSAAAVGEMKKIKSIFDPKGILNPYKVFPD